MNWDLTKFNQCDVHGHHAGKECPLCVDGPPVLVPEPLPEPEQYDRTTWHKGPEAELHGWLETEMIRLGISYIHGRMDKESTIRKGWPDFSLFYATSDGITRACFVELKNKSGRTSADQVDVIAELRAKNIPVLVTGNFTEAVQFIKTRLLYP